jgi:hypothetical protein
VIDEILGDILSRKLSHVLREASHGRVVDLVSQFHEFITLLSRPRHHLVNRDENLSRMKLLRSPPEAFTLRNVLSRKPASMRSQLATKILKFIIHIKINRSGTENAPAVDTASADRDFLGKRHCRF